jgi:hypothetical protein
MILRLTLYYTGPKWAVLRHTVVVLVGAWQKWPTRLCGRLARGVRYTYIINFISIDPIIEAKVAQLLL